MEVLIDNTIDMEDETVVAVALLFYPDGSLKLVSQNPFGFMHEHSYDGELQAAVDAFPTLPLYAVDSSGRRIKAAVA